MNGVSQHGVDERNNHFANNNSSNLQNNSNNNRGVLIRHANARNVQAGVNEHLGAPPSSTGRAWMESPNKLTSNVSSNGNYTHSIL